MPPLRMTILGWPGVEPTLGDSSRSRPLPKSVTPSGYSVALVPRWSLEIPTASDLSVTKCDVKRVLADHSLWATSTSSDAGKCLDLEGFRHGLIFAPGSAFSHEFRKLVSSERVAQCGEHLVVLLLFGVLARRFDRIQTRIDVA